MMPVIKNNQSWLPDVFTDFFDNDWMVPAKATEPAINVLEDEKSYKIELAAPGMVKDDFKISVDEDNNLVIKMEKKNETNDSDKKDVKRNDVRYWRHEFSTQNSNRPSVCLKTFRKTKLTPRWSTVC